MAFVSTLGWNVHFTVKDNNDNVSGFSVTLPAANTYAEVEAWAVAAAGALAAITDGLVVGYNISRSYTNDTPFVPAASSEVERKLKLTFHAGTFRNALTIEVPSPIFALEQPRTDVADPTNGALVSFVNLILNGPAGANNGVATYYGQNLTELSKAVIGHRSRKPRT